MLEKRIETKVCELALQEYNIPSIKLTPQGQTGYPDRMFFIEGGRPLFIEFKAPNKPARKKQLYIHKVLQDRGYYVYVKDNVKEAIEIIARAERGVFL